MNYFVFSPYINAYSIRCGLKRLGLELHVAAEESGLLQRSNEQPTIGDTLFFTDEKTLKKFLGQEYEFYPREVPEPLLDDKFEFAKFLVSLGEMPVPFAAVDRCDIPFPFILKARHSWLGERKLPRGFVCRSKDEMTAGLAKLDHMQIDRQSYYCQKYLPGNSVHAVSVCGFFDHADMQRNLMIVTVKVSGYPRALSTGVVVATAPDPRDLRRRAAKILGKMSFSGPFEMEFLYDKRDDAYYVLELNPRFWMQHGLFISAYDNGLLKRYLRIDAPAAPQTEPAFKKLLWIDTIALIYSSFHLRLDIPLQIVRHVFRGYRLCSFPDAMTAVLYLARMLPRRLKKHFVAHR